ncbi:MAG: tellurite resistance TerB family protein [Rhodobacterales bacterium]|nr:tellurite resistance TerB family protein [Rhodobacterales bacterium]
MGFLSTLVERYQDQLERQRNAGFLRATMAACALVATADGQVSFAQSVRVDHILQTLDALKVYDPHEGVDLFRDYADAILADPQAGRAAALRDVTAAADGPETAQLLVRVCLAVSEANGEKALVDQIEIVSLCSRLGVDPAACGLYPETGLPGLD